MWFIYDSRWLRIIAWFLQLPFCIFWVFLKLFSREETNRKYKVEAPQNPKIIVITGASQGIGEALVEYYYKRCSSCHTIIMISRSREKLETVKNRLNSNEQKKLVIYPCDVGDADGMKRTLLDVHQKYGHVDILFANAGISFRHTLEKCTFDIAVRETFHINIIGVINTILPLVEVKGVKQIAIMSSQAAYTPYLTPFYGTTKKCILSLGHDLRKELAKDNIAVNIIAPGPVLTPMLAGFYPRLIARGVTTDRAAEIIYDGLRRNQAEIVFPIRNGTVLLTFDYLPSFIADRLGFYWLNGR